MKTLRNCLLVLGGALIAFALVSILSAPKPASGAAVNTSSDVAMVPTSPMMTLLPATAQDVTVSPEAAVQTATAQWNLASGQIDENIGLVRADATIDQDTLHQHQKVWLMVADLPTAAPISGVQYARLVIVIDGNTGKYLYAYPVDPNQAEYRAVFGASTRAGHVGGPAEMLELRGGVPR